MARQFNGTDQALNSASALTLSTHPVITLSFWMYWDAFADDDDLAAEYTNNFNAKNGFIVDPNESGTSKFMCGMSGSVGGLYWLDVFTRPSAATWHQYIFEFNRTTPSNAVWVDNSSQSLTLNVHTLVGGTNYDDATFYLMSRGVASLFGAGRLFEFAIYDGTLTAGNRTSLQTSSPSVVGSPIYHWPICGTASPEPAAAGGIDMTVTGATFVANPSSLTGSTCNVSGDNFDWLNRFPPLHPAWRPTIVPVP